MLPQARSVATNSQRQAKGSTDIEKEEKTNPWGVCGKFAKGYADAESGSWKEEVEKLLVFAGLFSGVLTPLTLESIHGVREDSAKMSVILLQTIVHQLNNMTNPQPGISINVDPRADAIPQSARQINTLWSLSLVLSLTTVVAGILCLQWIREYSNTPNLPDREDLAVRYIRSTAVKKWRVSKVVATLPVLFITALILFLAGFILLLWHDDRTAAIPVVIVAGIGFCFFAATTFSPALQLLIISTFPDYQQPQCPWKSPQSYAFFKLCYPVANLLRDMRWKKTGVSFLPLFEFQGWRKYDWLYLNHGHAHKTYRTMHTLYSLGWVATMSFQHQKITNAIFECLRSLDFGEVAEALEGKGDSHRAGVVKSIQADLEAAQTETGQSEIVVAGSPAQGFEGLPNGVGGNAPNSSEQSPKEPKGSITTVMTGQSSTSTLTSNLIPDEEKKSAVGKPARKSSMGTKVKALDLAKDLVCWQVLWHLREKLEHGRASPTLLRLQLNLFLRVKETKQISQVLDCPVDCDNVGFLNVADRTDTLKCIQWMLRENLNCSGSHFVAAYAIIGETLSEGRERRIFAIPLVEEVLNDVLTWISKRPSNEDPDISPRFLREYRLRLAVPLAKLLRLCWRPREKRVLVDYCDGLDGLVKDVHGDVQVPDPIPSQRQDTLLDKFENLAKYSKLCERGSF